MPSKRELILDHIATTLAAITTGGGYNFTVGEARLGLKHFNQVPEDKFPAGYVAGADEDRVNATNSSFKSELIAAIIGYVRTADAANTEQLERDVSKLIEDFTKALLVDPTRGGNATLTEVQGIKADKGAWVPYAGFEMQLRCEYRATFAVP